MIFPVAFLPVQPREVLAHCPSPPPPHRGVRFRPLGLICEVLTVWSTRVSEVAPDAVRPQLGGTPFPVWI